MLLFFAEFPLFLFFFFSFRISIASSFLFAVLATIQIKLDFVLFSFAVFLFFTKKRQIFFSTFRTRKSQKQTTRARFLGVGAAALEARRHDRPVLLL